MAYKFDTTRERSELMKKIKSTGTTLEKKLALALWHSGIRYKKNYKALPGKPDIAITKHKIAIFIDGEFWHGYNWDVKKGKIKVNRDYWIKKIERNMERDAINTRVLKDVGWVVMRFWEKEVKKDIGSCINRVTSIIDNL